MPKTLSNRIRALEGVGIYDAIERSTFCLRTINILEVLENTQEFIQILEFPERFEENEQRLEYLWNSGIRNELDKIHHVLPFSKNNAMFVLDALSEKYSNLGTEIYITESLLDQSPDDLSYFLNFAQD